MSPQKKIVYCLILFLVCLNIIFRYPTMQHEYLPDTTFIHTLANSILQEGCAKWILHPLSYFGLYALSYPSAVPFTLATMSLTFGISVELCILLLGILAGIFGVISAFLAAREIKNNILFCFFVAFFFTTAPYFVHMTTWVGSTRGYVTALIPFLILLLLRHLNTQDIKYLFIAVVYLFVLFTVHRAGLLTVFIFIAYLATIPIHNILKRGSSLVLKHRKFLGLMFFSFVIILFISIFAIQFLKPDLFGGESPETAWGKTILLSGSSLPVMVLNVAIAFTGKVGPMIFLFLAGLFAISWQIRKEAEEKFLLLAFLFTLPFLSMRAYMLDLWPPLIVFMMGIGFFYIFNKVKEKRKKAAVVFVALCLVVPLGYSTAMRDYWRIGYAESPMNEYTYSNAPYLKQKVNGTVITNDPLTAGKLTAISGLPTLPLGGYSKHWHSALQLAYGYVSPDMIEVRLLKFSELSSSTDWIYAPESVPNAFAAWAYDMMRKDCDDVNYLLDEYNVHYALALTSLKHGDVVFLSEWWTDESELMTSANMKRYTIMHNSEVIIWYIQ